MFVNLLFVLFFGLAVNNENAETKVTTFDGFVSAVEQSIDERKPYDSGSLKNSKTGNFGNE